MDGQWWNCRSPAVNPGQLGLAWPCLGCMLARLFFPHQCPNSVRGSAHGRLRAPCIVPKIGKSPFNLRCICAAEETAEPSTMIGVAIEQAHFDRGLWMRQSASPRISELTVVGFGDRMRTWSSSTSHRISDQKPPKLRRRGVMNAQPSNHPKFNHNCLVA